MRSRLHFWLLMQHLRGGFKCRAVWLCWFRIGKILYSVIISVFIVLANRPLYEWSLADHSPRQRKHHQRSFKRPFGCSISWLVISLSIEAQLLGRRGGWIVASCHRNLINSPPIWEQVRGSVKWVEYNATIDVVFEWGIMNNDKYDVTVVQKGEGSRQPNGGGVKGRVWRGEEAIGRRVRRGGPIRWCHGSGAARPLAWWDEARWPKRRSRRP